jgi:aminoglycoside 6-adenylyltransferase
MRNKRGTEMTNTQIFAKILTIAEEKESIRAVLLEGSRANPNAKPDKWQDYDIIYVTRSNLPFYSGEWMKETFVPQFGEAAIYKIPFSNNRTIAITWYVQFTSGLQINVTFNTLKFLANRNDFESATRVLMDKDVLFRNVPTENDSDYRPKRPEEQEFLQCCNEFWWLSLCVAKALARERTLPAIDIFCQQLRPEYLKALSWVTGAKTKYRVDLGKQNWKIKQYSPPEYYECYEKSYHITPDDPLSIRAALNSLMSGFPGLAQEMASFFKYNYNVDEGKKTMEFLETYYRQ